jgi:hypothetical protein
MLSRFATVDLPDMLAPIVGSGSRFAASVAVSIAEDARAR